MRTEDTCFGRPRIDGTRLQVYDIITDLLYAESLDEVTEERELSRDDLRKVVDYCRSMTCKQLIKPYEKYCSGCILSTQHEGFDPESIRLKQLDEDIYQDENSGSIFLGTKEELEEELYGEVAWVLAEQMYERWMK